MSYSRRTIFIGTPHRGSKIASGILGKLASKLVRQSGILGDSTLDIIRLNKDAFAMPVKRIPTSVDLLKPNNPILQTIFDLHVNPRVSMHSIIGVGHKGFLGKEVSDGVVPVSRAQHPNVKSELFVDADHNNLHKDPRTIIEVLRILRLHASRFAKR